MFKNSFVMETWDRDGLEIGLETKTDETGKVVGLGIDVSHIPSEKAKYLYDSIQKLCNKGTPYHKFLRERGWNLNFVATNNVEIAKCATLLGVPVAFGTNSMEDGQALIDQLQSEKDEDSELDIAIIDNRKTVH